MPDLDGKYVIIEDSLSSRTPTMWVISAVADCAQAARSILNVDKEPELVARNAFSGEEIGVTLVLRSTSEGNGPQRAKIYRLRATADGEITAPPAPPVFERMSDELRAIDTYLLGRSGVATTDRDAYARLNMLGFLGSRALSAGDTSTAERHFTELLEIAQRIDHPPSIAKAYGSLGLVESQMGHSERAIANLNEALAVARRSHLVDEEGQTLANLAEAYATAGNGEQAIALHTEHRLFARRTGDRCGFALGTGNLGITYFEMGKLDEALQFLDVAADEFRALGMIPELGRALSYLAVVYQAKGDAQHCLQTYELHLELCRSIGDFSTAGSSYANLSEILYRNGRREEAIRLATEGYQQLQQIGAAEAVHLKKKLSEWQSS
jgi:tetratricopeptide (TPR) repeat protein